MPYNTPKEDADRPKPNDGFCGCNQPGFQDAGRGGQACCRCTCGCERRTANPILARKSGPLVHRRRIKIRLAPHSIRIEAKYKHLATNLDAALLNIVGDIIDKPPAQGKYDALKHRIIYSLSESQEVQLRRLLRRQPLGDEKPLLLLQRLRNLSAGQCGVSVLHCLILEQLPESVRGVLAMSELANLSKLAEHAYRVMEAMRPQLCTINKEEVNLVHRSAAQVESNNDTAKILSAIDKLKMQVGQLVKSMNSLACSRSRGRYVGSPAASPAPSANDKEEL